MQYFTKIVVVKLVHNLKAVYSAKTAEFVYKCYTWISPLHRLPFKICTTVCFCEFALIYFTLHHYTHTLFQGTLAACLYMTQITLNSKSTVLHTCIYAWATSCHITLNFHYFMFKLLGQCILIYTRCFTQNFHTEFTRLWLSHLFVF